MIGPLYDDYGVPLTRSGVGERLWALYNTDQVTFKREVKDYFTLGYPGFAVVKANYQQRIIWLRDDRRSIQ